MLKHGKQIQAQCHYNTISCYTRRTLKTYLFSKHPTRRAPVDTVNDDARS